MSRKVFRPPLEPRTRESGMLLSSALMLALLPTLPPAVVVAQEAAPLYAVGPRGRTVDLGARAHRGYSAVAASGLVPLGWAVERADGSSGWLLRRSGGPVVHLTPGDPFFRWDGEVRQLADPPYLRGDDLWIPAQLLLDFLPFHLPGEYGYAPGADGVELHLLQGLPGERARSAPAPGRTAATPDRGPRVVVIDPGHGGRDLGAVGRGGTNEKDVALALALALARELDGYPELEVHLTRDSDVLVPLWRRGEWATEVKGDRPGIFLSLHANALPNQTEARGFEIYFLSEARTEHERRVAALENAAMGGSAEGNGGDDGLEFILTELRNLDHQHWSGLLADLVQERMDPIHPGMNRGVKQAPFAVITNALMPAVLIEAGFMSNREEERLLGRPSFHEDVAGAVAQAVVEFFRRFPPGQGTELEPARPPSSGS